MDKLTAIKIQQNDGTYSNQIPVSVLAEYVDWNNNYNLIDILGSVDIQTKGNIQYQLNQLFNTKISVSELNNYIYNNLEQTVTNWLENNIEPIENTVVVDKSFSVQNAAADAKAVSDNFYTKIKLNQTIAKTTGEIRWQIPQGSVQKTNYTYSISGNQITLNGYVSGASVVRFFIYGSQLGSGTGNPTYETNSYQKYYLNPITSFTPGHRIQGEIKLISGTYQTDELYEDNTSKKPYFDLRDINHYANANWALNYNNNYQNIIDFQPQMIVLGVSRGNYENTVFEFSITDLDTKINTIQAKINNDFYFKNEINQIIANITGEIRWQIPEGTYNRNISNFSGNSIIISKNTITINGTRTGATLRIMINDIFNYTNGAPTYKTYPHIYYNPITSFIIGHKIKVKIKLLNGSYTLSDNNDAIYLDLRNTENSLISPFPWIFYDQNEKIIDFQPQMIAIGFPAGTYNNAVFEFSIIDMDSIGEKLNQLIINSNSN